MNFITDKIYCLIRSELFEAGNVSSSFSVGTEKNLFLEKNDEKNCDEGALLFAISPKDISIFYTYHVGSILTIPLL